MSFSTTIEIPPADIIPPYQHVHHAQILRYLELARCRYLEVIGLPNEHLLETGLFLVIAGIEIRYLREVRGGTISATCEEPRVSRRNIWIRQRLLNSRGKLLVDAQVDNMVFCPVAKRGIEVPEWLGKTFCEGLEGEKLT